MPARSSWRSGEVGRRADGGDISWVLFEASFEEGACLLRLVGLEVGGGECSAEWFGAVPAVHEFGEGCLRLGCGSLAEGVELEEAGDELIVWLAEHEGAGECIFGAGEVSGDAVEPTEADEWAPLFKQ
jgi:hypothetical protein